MPFASRAFSLIAALALPVSVVHAAAPTKQAGAAAPTPAANSAASAARQEIFGARPGETRLADRLVGLRFVATPAQLHDPGWPAAGLDVSRVPLLQNYSFALIASLFLDKPVSGQSLHRLILGVRQQARLQGKKFLSIYLPPQDITGGYVQIVVSQAHSEGPVVVQGAKYFSTADYRAALRQPAGQPIDAVRLQTAVDWINRNPYRHAVLAAEPGAKAGATVLVLNVSERRPWRVNAGFDNTGSPVTGEDRISGGFEWGNALGRGDVFDYTFIADPTLDHSRTHSVNYSTWFRSGRSLTFYGAYTAIASIMPEPFTQKGTSWQAGLRYGVPLKKSARGWERSLSLSADFKYSDNNLEFAAIPVTNNVTHIAQLGASFTGSRQWATRRLGLTFSLYASPGGITGHNNNASFDGSRAGAKAAYVYGKLDAQFSQQLPRGFWWSTTAGLQKASGPLLGTEQLNGGGAYAVRGYRDNSAFGDDGIVLNNELHLPAVPLVKDRDQLDPFAFVDAAVLDTQGPGADTFDLASAGLGLNYQFGRAFSLRVAYGWTLRDLPGTATPASGGHFSANFSF